MRRWLLWAVWVAACCLGVQAAAALAALVPWISIRGATGGIVLGLLQWMVLRRYATVSWWWIVATSAGMAAAKAVGQVLTDSALTVPELELLAGAIAAACQWPILSRHVRRSEIWVPVHAIGWTAGALALNALWGSWVPGVAKPFLPYAARAVLVVGCSGWLLGAITGIPIAIWFGSGGTQSDSRS